MATIDIGRHRGVSREHPHPVGPLVSRAFRDRLTLVVVVSALMVGMGLMVGSLWPALQGTLADLQASLPDMFVTMLAGADMSTASGWANAEMMSMVAPGGVLAVGVISGVKATATEEENKTMGMTLGAPVTRTAFLLAKSVAMLVHVAIVSAAVGAGLTLGSLLGDMDLSVAKVVGATLHVGALGLLFGAVAISVGAWSGNAKLTTSVAAGLGALSFAVASFLPLSASLADGVRLSPWYYYNHANPLTNGADLLHLTVLLGLGILVLAAGIVGFRRRDLRG